MPDKEDPGKGKILIIAALVIISALGVMTYYDEQGNILVNNTTHDVVIGKETKIEDYSKMNETTTVKVVYEGLTPIKDSLTSPSKTSSDAVILKAATESVMSKVSYPYNVTKAETQTTFKIFKYRCDEKMGICGYWIEAWRDGKEVYTNSPIWISPPPHEVFVSESTKIISETEFDKVIEKTVTIKEDPKLALEITLQQYVDRQPLGKAVSYEV